MDTNEVVTSEDLQAEQDAVKPINQEEIRANIISEFGFDETIDAERIDKLTQKEMKNRKMLSSSIAAKIKHRTKVEELEKAGKENKPEVKSNDNLSTKDLYALTSAKVPEEDIDEVLEYAKFKKISISDALKSSTVKTLLSEKAEIRSTAEAANTGTARRATNKVTGDVLIERARAGELPNSDEDMDKLAEARMIARKAKK